MKIINQTVLNLLKKYEEIFSLKYLTSLSMWDTETYMPTDGVALRSKVIGNTEKLIQSLTVSDEFSKLLKKANQEKELNDYERAILRQINYTYKKYTKLPSEFVERYSKLIAESSTRWTEAKKENKYEIFKPYLEKVFEYTIEAAKYIGYKNHPYEALISDFEPEYSFEDTEKYFTELKSVLNKFDLKKSLNHKVDFPQNFDQSKMKELCLDILKLFNIDFNKFRIDESHHPFMDALGKNDVRITTNYDKSNPLSPIYAVIHEFGHALFAMQVDEEFEITPLLNEISYGIHESQSHFWENQITQSEDFLKLLVPMMRKLGPEFKDITPKQIYNKIIDVKPSLIRIEADELTYHYHILIRYEVEKMLLDKSINFDEAPKVWADKYEEYLGVRPKNISEGMLQDIHWSQGYIGYFPSYSMGMILACVIDEKMQVDRNDFDAVKKWLAENIHNAGGTYTFKELMQKLSNKDLDMKPWEKYITKKYSYLLK